MAIGGHRRGVERTTATPTDAFYREPFFVNDRAVLRFHADCETIFGHVHQPAIVQHWSWNVRAFVDGPQRIFFGHVATATDLQCERSLRLEPARNVRRTVCTDDPRADVAARLDRGIPKQFTSIRVDAPDFARHCHDEIDTVTELDQCRRAERQRQPFPIGFPDLFSRLFIQSDDRPAFTRRVHNDEVFVEDDAGRRSPTAFVRLGADTRLPKCIAVQVECNNPRLAEESVDGFAIGGGRVTGVTMFVEVATEFVFCITCGNIFRPQNLARKPIDADQMPSQLRDVTRVGRIDAIAGVTRHECPIAQDDRRG